MLMPGTSSGGLRPAAAHPAILGLFGPVPAAARPSVTHMSPMGTSAVGPITVGAAGPAGGSAGGPATSRRPGPAAPPADGNTLIRPGQSHDGPAVSSARQNPIDSLSKEVHNKTKTTPPLLNSLNSQLLLPHHSQLHDVTVTVPAGSSPSDSLCARHCRRDRSRQDGAATEEDATGSAMMGTDRRDEGAVSGPIVILRRSVRCGRG